MSPAKSGSEKFVMDSIPVSYTHLDVYKRQLYTYPYNYTETEVYQNEKEMVMCHYYSCLLDTSRCV